VVIARLSVALSIGGLGLGLLAGCASTGVTLHSNHYSAYVPPGWQVIEAGGAPLPTVLRVPGDDGAPTVDVRVYAWLVDAPVVDPAGDALKRLAAGDAVGLGTAHGDDTCGDRADGFLVLGRPARAIHQQNEAGQRIVVTGGEAYGSLVAVVGVAPSGSSCAGVEAIDLAVKRLVPTLSGTADASRSHAPTMILEQPRSGTGAPLEVTPPPLVP